MRLMLIANPTAGQGRVRWIAGFIQSALERHGAEVTLVLTGGPRDAAEAAHYALKTRRFERIVVAGGDGTINQVVGELVGTDLPLAILPLGTANSLAREIRLPFNLMHAARVAVQGSTVPVDVGRVNGVYFLLEVSAGFDAAVVTAVRRPLKRWLGPGAYLVSGLPLLRSHAPFHITCEADGHVFEADCNMVVGANTSTYVYGVKLARQASIHDGLIDLCILDAREHPLTWQVVAAICNRLGPRVGARTVQARRVRLECSPPAAVQIDGDPAGETPIELECVPRCLNLVVPQRYLRRYSRLHIPATVDAPVISARPLPATASVENPAGPANNPAGA